MPSKIVCSASAMTMQRLRWMGLLLKKALFQSRQRAAKSGGRGEGRRGRKKRRRLMLDDERGRNTQVIAEDSSQTTARGFYLRQSPNVGV